MSGLRKQKSIDYDYYKSDKSSEIKKKKLILHFDQHNTIQVACTLPGRSITVEEGLNNFLTSVVWGKELENGEWEWISTEPQLYKPSEDAITYFKYLEKQIVKSPNDRAELKKKTTRFVYEDAGERFREFFDLYLKALTFENNDNINCNNNSEHEPDSDKIKNNLTNNIDNNEILIDLNNKINKPNLPPNTIPADNPSNKSLYHLILPDFFDMIRRLQKDNRNFSIILRTMGIDSQNFLDTIRPIIEGKHRDFKDLKPIKINNNIGHIKRDSYDKIELHMDNEIYAGDESIYNKLNSLEGINAIRDDFAYWQKNDYECYSAKPLWINLQDNEYHHILFDDNIRLDAVDDCIVNIRINNFLNEYENVEFECYKIFEKSSILQPNLIELLNPLRKTDSTKNHYFEKIKKAEIIYHKILANKENIKISTQKSLDELSSSSNSVNIKDILAAEQPISKETVLNNDISLKENEKILFNSKKPYARINKPFKKQIEDEKREVDEADKTVTTTCLMQ